MKLPLDGVRRGSEMEMGRMQPRNKKTTTEVISRRCIRVTISRGGADIIVARHKKF